MPRLLCALLVAAVTSGCGVVAYSPPANEVCGHITDEHDKSLCEERLSAASARERADDGAKHGYLWGAGFTTFGWIAYYLIGLVFARFVYVDARRRDWLAFRIGPIWWGAVCVFEPALGALVYWTLHYSRFARPMRGPDNALEQNADVAQKQSKS